MFLGQYQEITRMIGESLEKEIENKGGGVGQEINLHLKEENIQRCGHKKLNKLTKNL